MIIFLIQTVVDTMLVTDFIRWKNHYKLISFVFFWEWLLFLVYPKNMTVVNILKSARSDLTTFLPFKVCTGFGHRSSERLIYVQFISCAQEVATILWQFIVKPIKKYKLTISFPVNNYLFKVNNRNSRKRCQICSKLIIRTYFAPFPSISFVDFK